MSQFGPKGARAPAPLRGRLFMGASMAAFAAALGASPAQAQTAAVLRGVAGIGNAATAASPAPVQPNRPPTNTLTMHSAAVRALNHQARVSQAVDLALQAQDAARKAALALNPNVPNGLIIGGLRPAADLTSAENDTTGLHTWDGAERPTQTTDGAVVTVTIDQTESRAILSWETFNVGQDTTLVFNQTVDGVGQADWLALNRVVGQLDPNTGLRDASLAPAPSQILGKIQADGGVLILNQNGVLFGANSQVNVRSLIGTSLEVGRALAGATPLTIKQRNTEFLSFGLLGYRDLASPNDRASAFTFSSQAIDGATYDPLIEGEIRVEAGAQITADNGGLILLTGPRVLNAGHLQTFDGQISLQGGRLVTLQRSEGRSDSLDPNVRGLVVSAENRSDSAGNYVVNTGLIESTRGYLSLGATSGGAVIQDGVLFSTTSVSRNGFIDISGGDIKIAEDSVLAVEPDQGKETIPQDPVSVDAFKSSRVEIGDTNSRIEIGSDSLIHAPSGDILIGARPGIDSETDTANPEASRIFIDSGAVIDAAGIKNVLVPASRNRILIRPVKRNELRDTPNYKDGFLNGVFVYVDPRISGVREDGVAWVGSPLIEAESYYQQVGVTVSELMTRGGNVSLGVASAAGGEGRAPDVIVKSGAVIDITGGWVRYEAGAVQTTRLISANGQVVDISDADPNGVYIGVYNGYTDFQGRWGVAKTWVNPLLSGQQYVGEFTEGRDAGTLTIKASATVLDGTVYADAFPGSRQLLDGNRGTGQSGVFGDLRRVQAAPSQLPMGGLLYIQALGLDRNDNVTGGGDIQIVDETGYTELSSGFDYGQSISIDASGELVLPPQYLVPPLPSDRLGGIVLSDQALSGMGLGQLSLHTTGGLDVAADAELRLTSGGVFDALAGRKVTIDGGIYVPSGAINIETANFLIGSPFIIDALERDSFDISIRGVLSTRGEWVNNYGASADQLRTTAYTDGGSVSLISAPRVAALIEVVDAVPGEDEVLPEVNTDFSGSILVKQGSLIDVSGGGSVGADGALDLTARGGDLTLINDTAYFQLTDDQTRPAGGLSGFRVTTIFDTVFNQRVAVNPDAINSRIQLAGTILAHGFNGGGTFNLRAPEFQFGDRNPQVGAMLPLEFFSETGFANYSITSYKTELLPNDFNNGLGGFNAVLATQTISIGDGQTLNLTQSMFSQVLDVDQTIALQSLASGGDLYSVLDPGVPVEAWDRRAANLSLGGMLELHVEEGGQVIGEPGAVLSVAKLLNDGRIRIAGGTIRQSEVLPQIYTSQNSIGVRELSEVFSFNRNGRINEEGLNAAGLTDPETGELLTNAQVAARYFIYFLGELEQNEGVRLARGSLTDLSGTVVLDPRAQAARPGPDVQLRTGRVVDGGTLELLAARLTGENLFRTSLAQTVYSTQNPEGVRAGSIINLQRDSHLDLSGASGVFDAPMGPVQYGSIPGASVMGYGPQAVWSDAGRLYAGAGGILGGADIRAFGGSDQALGGTLIFLDPTLRQEDSRGMNMVSADLIERSGFDTFAALGSLDTFKDVTLHLDRGFFVLSRPYGGEDLNNAGVRDNLAPIISASGRLEVIAPYIRLASDLQTISTPAYGTAKDNVDTEIIFRADNIDIQGAILFDQSVDRVRLSAQNDLRLTGVRPYQLTFGLRADEIGNSLRGMLAVNGDLSIVAGQVYPTTGSSFALTSAALDGKISFDRSNADTPDTPYSAGGDLLIQASEVVHRGVIRVPLGKLTIGSNTEYSIGEEGDARVFAPVTNFVKVQAGSLTSVSADGLIIPYGTTTDQIEWFFEPTGESVLKAPPAGILDIGGASVELAEGATVDISGGGDLYAYEFVSGTGGSRDVLDRFNPDPFSGNDGFQYPDERQVYAVVPGLSDQDIAAFDPIYSSDYSDLYSVSQAGRRVYLTGIPGLDAGWYTLLPAKYALLPGGFRVVEQTGADAAALGRDMGLLDGSQIVTGYYGDAAANSRESTVRTFQVMSQSVIKKYSTIATTFANQKFAADAAKNDQIAPRLPIDAGRLILDPSQNLFIDTTLITTPGQGGRGAEADISGLNFQIVSARPDQAVDGAIVLTADSLTNLNASSLLIGGVRTNNADGTTSLDVTASSIVVANDAEHPLVVPETILAVDGSGSSITLSDGATITASGTSANEQREEYVIDGAGDMTGVGAVVRVASGGERLVRRDNVDAEVEEQATLTVGDVNLNGGSVLLASSGDLTIDPAAGIVAKLLAVGASQVTFTDDPDAVFTGLVITPRLQALFAKADRLTVQSPGTIDFTDGAYSFGNLRLDTPGLLLLDGDQVTLTANVLELSNVSAQGLACDAEGAAACGDGDLLINAREIVFGSGDVRTYGFGGSATLTASQGVFVEGKGSFDVGPAQLALQTPFLGDRALPLESGQSALIPSLALITSGAVAISGGGEFTAPDGTPGARLSISGQSVSISGARIRATAGTLDIKAQTDISIGDGAVLETPGYDKTFGDEADPYVVAAPGGLLHLTALEGDIDLATGSLLSVGGGQGRAGTLQFTASRGEVSFGGVLDASSRQGGGSFLLDIGSAFDLNSFASGMADGFSGAIDIRTGAGDLLLGEGFGLTAENVVLTADGGLVDIAGTIDVSGVVGGDVGLYGLAGVTLRGTARIDAHADGYGERDTRRASAGDVEIGTDGDGVITVESGALIDVSARRSGDRLVPSIRNGTVYYTYVRGDSGGVVHFRAPLLERAGGDGVNVFYSGSISGARGIVLEAFKAFDLGQIANDPNFTGVTLNADGQVVLDLGQTADGRSNWLADDASGSLVEFVQTFDLSGATGSGQLGDLTTSPVFHARPGMDLGYDGDIVLASNWNLGAGAIDVAGAVAAGFMAELPNQADVPVDQRQYYVIPGKEDEVFSQFTTLTYRTNEGAVDGEPGLLTLRAGGDLHIGTPDRAVAISDGFFVFGDQTDQGYLSRQLGGGGSFDPYIPTLCQGNNCAIVGDWQPGDVIPPGYVNIGFFGGLQGLLFNPAPYSAAANSPVARGGLAGGGGDVMGGAQLFPLLNTEAGQSHVDSWSYRLVGGADLTGALGAASVDPLRTLAGSGGDVIVQGRNSYTFEATAGDASFTSNLLLRVGAEYVDPDNWLDAFLAANPTLDSSAYTFINFDFAPGGVTDILGGFATDFFAEFPDQHQLIVDRNGAPTGVTTTLELAARFFAEVVAPNFGQLVGGPGLYGDPRPVLTRGETTAYTQTLVRTGAGNIEVAAAQDIDLRNGEPFYLDANGRPTRPEDGFQAGGVAIYTAGHMASLAPRTLVDSLTGQTFTLDPSAYGPSETAFQNAQRTGYRYGAGGGGLTGVFINEPAYAEGGGDVSLEAGNDVLGRRDLFGAARLVIRASSTSQYGWIGTADQSWRTGLIGPTVSVRINPQLFREGLGALAGGDIDIRAGGDVSDLSLVVDSGVTTADVSRPGGALTSRAMWILDGGNIRVNAGGDLLAGRIDIASGSAEIEVGGDVASLGDISVGGGGGLLRAENVLRARVTDASVSISARGEVLLQGVGAFGVQRAVTQVESNLNARGFYTDVAAFSVLANGEVTVQNRDQIVQSAFGGDLLTAAKSDIGAVANAVLPGSFEAISLTGDLHLITTGANNVADAMILYPSSIGTLRLLAAGDINDVIVAMEDGDPGLLPGAFSSFRASIDGLLAGRAFIFPGVLPNSSDLYLQSLHNPNITHLGDREPSRVYAGGDIGGMIISLPEQARIGAGRDIVNMMFFGQNVDATDITRIYAGRDITATTELVRPVTDANGQVGASLPAVQGNAFVIGGPGSFFLEAGRDAGPFLTSATTDGFAPGEVDPFETGRLSYAGGIISVGNEWNRELEGTGADIYTMFGVGPGVNYLGFRDYYLDPANLANLDGDLFEQETDALGVSVPDRSRPIYGPILVKWMAETHPGVLQNAYGRTDVSYEEAYAAFAALPQLQQRVFILSKVYFNELQQTSLPDGPSYLQYSRGYLAVNTLFPAEYGYTLNDQSGGSNGANELVVTGNLDLRLATIQTARGGDIYILGPGGRLVAGSTVRTSQQAARRASDAGRLYAGDTPRAPLAANIASIPIGFEGVLTLRGGGVYSFTDQDFLLNQSRLFTLGGGDIAMWSSNGDLNAGQGPKTAANFPPVVVRIDENGFAEEDTAGAVSGAGIGAFQPAAGVAAPNVFLIAPRGTVDAGDAGVRVAGNLFIAALAVANANNFSVGGATVGIPTSTGVDVGVASSASAASAAAQQAAEAATGQAARRDPRSIITADVLGYVGGEDECDREGPNRPASCDQQN